MDTLPLTFAHTVQNACGVDNGGCSQICVTSNTSSDAYCACEGGYILDSDGKQCIGEVLEGVGREVKEGSNSLNAAACIQ